MDKSRLGGKCQHEFMERLLLLLLWSVDYMVL